jgi:hypothetical protein
MSLLELARDPREFTRPRSRSRRSLPQWVRPESTDPLGHMRRSVRPVPRPHEGRALPCAAVMHQRAEGRDDDRLPADAIAGERVGLPRSMPRHQCWPATPPHWRV